MFKGIHHKLRCLDRPIPQRGRNYPPHIPTYCKNKGISFYCIGDSPYDDPELLAWFCVHCAACTTKTHSFCTTITQPNVFSRCGQERREKSLSERNESMKVFLVDDSAANYFFDKVMEIEKIYDTFKLLLKDKS